MILNIIVFLLLSVMYIRAFCVTFSVNIQTPVCHHVISEILSPYFFYVGLWQQQLPICTINLTGQFLQCTIPSLKIKFHVMFKISVATNLKQTSPSSCLCLNVGKPVTYSINSSAQAAVNQDCDEFYSSVCLYPCCERLLSFTILEQSYVV